MSHWNTVHTTKTLQTGQATFSLQRPLDPSTSGWFFLLFLCISLIGLQFAPCSCIKWANLFRHKITHFTTEQNSIASRGSTLWLSVATFQNVDNCSFSSVKTICQSWFTDLFFTSHQACTFMHHKYCIPCVAINVHQLS